MANLGSHRILHLSSYSDMLVVRISQGAPHSFVQDC